MVTPVSEAQHQPSPAWEPGERARSPGPVVGGAVDGAEQGGWPDGVGRFAWERLIADPALVELTSTQYAVLMSLAQRADNGSGKVWTTTEALARQCRLSDRATREALKVARAAGLVVRAVRGNNTPSGPTKSLYLLTDPGRSQPAPGAG